MRKIAIFSIVVSLFAATAHADDPNLDIGPADPRTATESSRGVPLADFDIRIDFGNSGTPPDTNWNLIAGGNLASLTSGLVDFTSGSSTSVSIDGTGSPWSNFFGDEALAFPETGWIVQPSTEFGAGLLSGNSGTYQIDGLPAGELQIEIVSARPFDYQNFITVDGSNADRTGLGTPVQTPWSSQFDGLEPGNWLIWDAVTATGGSITIDVSGNGTLSMINALRIVTSGSAPVVPTLPVPVGGYAWTLLLALLVLTAGFWAFRIR